MTTVEDVGRTPQGEPVQTIRIAAEGISAEILTLGAGVHRLDVAGRNVVLGHPGLEGYLGSRFYAGMSCGRFANRIASGRFTLDGVDHQLATNENGNTLHGGPSGFDSRVWTVEHVTDHSVLLTLISEDGDQGFPGTVGVRVLYEVFPGEMRVVYGAVTDAPTPLNLTTHPYFNLHGEGSGSVDDHRLVVAADHVLTVGPGLIPTGEAVPVVPSGTIGELAPLDSCFVVRGEGFRHHATLSVPDLELQVWSDQPGLQVYTGDALNPDVIGTSGGRYCARAGVALETQNFPDAPNHPDFPNSILRPGETYRAETNWVFRAR